MRYKMNKGKRKRNYTIFTIPLLVSTLDYHQKNTILFKCSITYINMLKNHIFTDEKVNFCKSTMHHSWSL